MQPSPYEPEGTGWLDNYFASTNGAWGSSSPSYFTLVAEPNADGSGWVIARARFLM